MQSKQAQGSHDLRQAPQHVESKDFVLKVLSKSNVKSSQSWWAEDPRSAPESLGGTTNDIEALGRPEFQVHKKVGGT